MKKRSSKPGINRHQAMSACPRALPPLRTEVKDGKRHVTVELGRPRWQQWMGGDTTCERTFGLDAFGQEVYDACDGSTTVTDIVKRFSKKHHIDHAEAELNVTTFLKTLISKGLVGIPLSEESLKTTEVAS